MKNGTGSNAQQRKTNGNGTGNQREPPNGSFWRYCVCVCVFFYHPNNPVHGSAGERSMEISSMARRVSNFDVRGHPVGLSQTK